MQIPEHRHSQQHNEHDDTDDRVICVRQFQFRGHVYAQSEGGCVGQIREDLECGVEPDQAGEGGEADGDCTGGEEDGKSEAGEDAVGNQHLFPVVEFGEAADGLDVVVCAFVV